MKPILKKNMPNDEYHAHSAVSRSGLMKIHNQSPYHFKHEKDNGGIQETDALRLGGAFHTLVLEPHLFESQYHIFEKPDLRTKTGKERMAEIKEQAGDKTLLNADEHANMLAMAKSITEQPAAKKLIHEKGIVEGSFFYQDDETGVEVKARPDWHVPELITDLKTAESANPRAFEKKIVDYGYDVQVYMTMKALEKYYGEAPEAFVFVVVEKKPPYACAFYIADADVIAYGKRRYEDIMAVYAHCVKTGDWYGYGNNIQPISLPYWAMKQMEFDN